MSDIPLSTIEAAVDALRPHCLIPGFGSKGSSPYRQLVARQVLEAALAEGGLVIKQEQPEMKKADGPKQGVRYSFTQPICIDCWRARHPGRYPAIVKSSER